MTVADLIDELSKYPLEYEVYLGGLDENENFDIGEVIPPIIKQDKFVILFPALE